MTIHAVTDDKIATITLGSTFDFSAVEEFRKAYSSQTAKEYIVDFRDTEYMDSSGLGMLLNMKRHLEGAAEKISLINCRTQVKKILLISRFEQKFHIT
ncbi:STAS domain-containing protein [Oceanicoccus sagamiensis]|uniref:Anti-anti-sigma factor n=1 Tax=Oceanicoccus sagamiensis TaxID=716816 RepID=A0A1X9NBJ2_9GAMM|nr:STAS domain-containing protein [Oceanicoccus sagamiensis]ARN74976.1 anti-anti-sigma factor [Oceanicoccus sagamiensis]